VTNFNSNKVQAAIYIRNDLDYCIISSPVPKDLADVYSSAVKLKVNEDLSINILSVYFPKGTDNIDSNWLRSFDVTENWIVCGDFNTHSPLWDKGCHNISNNSFNESVIDSDLILINDGRITRIPDVSTHRPSALDLTFVSPNIFVDCVWDIDTEPLGSDHLPITLTFNNNYVDTETENDSIPKYIYSRADWDLFQSLLLSYNTDYVNNDSINDMYIQFMQQIHSAAAKSIPQKRTSYRRKHTGNIWWNDICETAVKEKKIAYKNWLKFRSDENFKEMKTAKIKCNKVIASEKRKFWYDYCSSAVNNSQDTAKVWKKISEMKNGFQLPQCPLKLLDNKFPSPHEKAEEFVKVFANVSNSHNLPINVKNKREYLENTEEYDAPPPDDNLYINSEIKYEEVQNAILELGRKRSAVGLDGISYNLLMHLPVKWVNILHTIINKCWSTGIIPDLWKSSLTIPILKSGKPRSDVSSYRPIALTSHVCKVMEKIVLERMSYYCIKQNVIPLNQAGFQKGRSTVDHLVKITTHIKRQFAKRKSVLATFFDVTKAYDRVWHARLLYKLKSIGLSGRIYYYIGTFLKDRNIKVKVGNSYSSSYKTNMGIPQGSIISPILFNILIYDLPQVLSNKVSLVQYADDIAIWMNVNLKKKTSLYEIKHITQVYQQEINNISYYMNTNGLELSKQKTNLVLFNHGQEPRQLPKLVIENEEIKYVKEVKFLGVYLTCKLHWKRHIDYVIQKAVKSYNLLKIISRQNWGQDVKTLIHLACSLVRSKLTYGQEAYFSAPKCYLKKLQSLDSKAVKLALGVPIHTNTAKAYKLAGIIPLDEWRKICCAKYIVRACAVDNSTDEELFVRSDLVFPKQAQKVQSFQTISTFTKDLVQIDLLHLQNSPKNLVSPIPPWELEKAKYDIYYCNENKTRSINITVVEAQLHLNEQYSRHLKIYTDGSVLETGEAGAAFVIPEFNISESYYLGKGYSIFSAELVGILMALNKISNLSISIFNIVICVDSMSALQALNSECPGERKEIILEIKNIIHGLITNGTQISFCWIPSHCGFLYNDWADRAAKFGALNVNAQTISMPLSCKEIQNIIENKFVKDMNFNLGYDKPCGIARLVLSTAYRIMLNAIKTKYCKGVNCICNEPVSLKHVLLECRHVRPFLPTDLHSMNSIDNISFDVSIRLAKALIDSSVGSII
jgi:ribonuclease HI/L-rhamnose mutarotase